MNIIRKGNTIIVRWSILTNGEALSLEGRNLKVFITSAATRLEVTDYALEGHEITFKWEGAEQRHAGRYDVTLYENYGKANQSVVDVCNAFTLVERSCQAKGVIHNSNIDVEYVELASELSVINAALSSVMTVTFSPCGSEEKYAVGQVSGELFEKFFDELPDEITDYYYYGDMGYGENFSGIGEWDTEEETDINDEEYGEVGA